MLRLVKILLSRLFILVGMMLTFVLSSRVLPFNATAPGAVTRLSASGAEPSPSSSRCHCCCLSAHKPFYPLTTTPSWTPLNMRIKGPITKSPYKGMLRVRLPPSHPRPSHLPADRKPPKTQRMSSSMSRSSVVAQASRHYTNCSNTR
jgi:hypothetical protein